MATEAVQHIEGELHRAFSDRMPSAASIAESAVERCLADRSSDAAWMKAHFSAIADTAMLAAQETYLDAQRHAEVARDEDPLVLAHDRPGPAKALAQVGVGLATLVTVVRGALAIAVIGGALLGAATSGRRRRR